VGEWLQSVEKSYSRLKSYNVWRHYCVVCVDDWLISSRVAAYLVIHETCAQFCCCIITIHCRLRDPLNERHQGKRPAFSSFWDARRLIMRWAEDSRKTITPVENRLAADHSCPPERLLLTWLFWAALWNRMSTAGVKPQSRGSGNPQQVPGVVWDYKEYWTWTVRSWIEAGFGEPQPKPRWHCFGRSKECPSDGRWRWSSLNSTTCENVVTSPPIRTSLPSLPIR